MKKVFSVLLVLMMGAVLFALGVQDDDKPYVGVSIQSLKNDYWAGVMGQLEGILESNGYKYTIVACDDNPAAQISQVENFIVAGVDMILVHPSDPVSLETFTKEAGDAGIKVMCWDNSMINTTVNWVLDNIDLGRVIGRTAAEFINEHYSALNPAEVVVIGFPSTKVLLERAMGIKEGLAEAVNVGAYRVVAEIDGLEANDAQTNVETALQANPNAAVFIGVGAGAMIGSNEALLQKYGGKGKIPANVGVIATDVTLMQLKSLKSGNEAVRAIVGFEGSNYDTAEACFVMFERIIGGERFSEGTRDVYRPTRAITIDDVDLIIAGM